MRAKIEGFIVYVSRVLPFCRRVRVFITRQNRLDYVSQFKSAATEMAQWIAEGKIKRKFHVVEGLENAPEGLMLLFNGGNTGKL